MADKRFVPLLRGGFLLAVVAFAGLGLRGRYDEVGGALRDTSVAGALGALVLVLVGLLATGVLWWRLMAWLDAPLPFVEGLSTFFVGQLGKYIPGSVWSIGAQADLARRHAVPPRVTVAAGLLFLGYHVDTAVLLGGLTLLGGSLDAGWPDWVTGIGLLLAVVGLAPAVVRAAGRKVGGTTVRLGRSETAAIVALMAVAWTSYALALVLLAPGLPWSDLVAFGGAFAAAYAVGVVVVLAPAGVGAREGVFVLLLSPVVGVGAATALALLARVVHSLADALMAAGWWFAARRARVPVGVTRRVRAPR